jgi:nodulation protein E
MQYGLRGPVFGVTSACSTANHAFASAWTSFCSAAPT